MDLDTLAFGTLSRNLDILERLFFVCMCCQFAKFAYSLPIYSMEVKRLEKSALSRFKKECPHRKPFTTSENQIRRNPNYGHRNSLVWKRNESHNLPKDRPSNSKNHTHENSVVSTTIDGSTELKGSSTLKDQVRVCRFWLSGNCVKGDKCGFLHSRFLGDGFVMLAELQGHLKAIKGVALPSGSDKLYSASSDGTVRIWDCHSGKCVNVINLGAEVGCLISEGPWLFVGMPNMVKVWNMQTATEFTLEGPIGQVNAMTIANDMLFAGAHDGTISTWIWNPTTNQFQLVASLKGHSGPVACLIGGGQKLYSGSVDHTIRVWDIHTLQSVATLKGHTGAVMSVICWREFLFSCSLDQTINVWKGTQGGGFEVTYTHKEEHGVLTLCGVHDAEVQPILLCSCNDGCVYLYDLPSFQKRGTMFSKREVRVIEIGVRGLFFTGDGSGKLIVWNLLGKPSAEAS